MQTVITMKAVLLLVAMLALCAAGLPANDAPVQQQARRPYLPEDDCPKVCNIQNIQPVCAAEIRGNRARLRTFATECEIRKFNCATGSRYVFLFNGGCPNQG